MANVATITPLNQFFDTNGSPLTSGYLYFGLPNQDPEQFPVQMYWDEAGTIPALQPIRTISGYPSRAGSPAIIYGPDSYSLRVRSSSLVQVLYAPSLGGVSSASSLSASDGSSLVGFIQAGTGAIARTAQNKMREWVSVKDFGAVGDGVTNDTAAFLAACTAHSSVYIPQGTYILSDIIFPSTLKKLMGSGKSTILQAPATLATTTWLTFNNQSDLIISDFAMNISSTTHPTVVGMQLGLVLRGQVRNLSITDGGRFPIYLSQCSGVNIDDIFADNYAASAIVVENASGNVRINNVIATKVGTGNCIVITGGSYHEITNCYAAGAGAAFFTIALIGTFDSRVSNCVALGTILEAIQVTDGSRNQITNNTVVCGASHNDFGISVFGDAVDAKWNLISGNTVVSSGKSGIGVSANFVTGKLCAYTLVEDNLIVSCNVINDADGAGVYVLGGATCVANTIQNNSVIDEGNKIRYGVYESSSGGLPDNNRFIHNACFGGAVFIAEGFAVGTNTEIYDLQWNTSTPTPTAQGGSIAGSTATVKVKRKGRQADIAVNVSIGGTNTGTGYVVFAIPVTLAAGVLAGQEGATGKMLQGSTGGANLLRLYDYAHLYPTTAINTTLTASGTVQI